MLFSLAPKKYRRDLFDRTEEFEDLKKSIETFPITLLTGVRRVGKSSLIRVLSNEPGLESLLIDGRALYANSGGNVRKMDLVSSMEKGLESFSKFERLKGFLKNLKGVSMMGNSLSFNWRELDLIDLTERLERFSWENKTKAVLFFDEAQYLRHYGSRGGKDILAFFSYVYDRFESVRIVLTGSEVGLLHDFMAMDDYSSPLYGRILKEIPVKPFPKELSAEFLKTGFEESNTKIDFNPEDVIEILDGTPGYLVQFGVKYIESGDVNEALNSTIKTISVMLEGEIEELNRRSRRYAEVLKVLSGGPKTWSGIRDAFFANADPLSDSRLYDALTNLEKMCWIKKENNLYEVIDPVMNRVIATLR